MKKTERQIREGITDLWKDFQKSSAERQTVLAYFDEAIEEFKMRPRVAGFFARLKNAFLEAEKQTGSEVKN